MADRSVVVRLKAEIGQYVAGMQKAKTEAKQFGQEISGQGKTAQADLDKIGRGALLMASGVAVGFGLAAKAAMDWESSWAGVTKTVNGSASEMADLENGLRDLAKELPATHGEIAAVAEAAGALGIQRSSIEGFTKTMIDLGETTNVTADQAATSFAQIGNIMGTAQDDFDRMGSTLVHLGNNGASTEAEILELANRLAAAGKIAGLTEADIFAMASTLASVGVEAEAGGTALSKVFTTMSDAVLDGSDKLDTFAEVAGTTAEDFAASFRDDPAVAINEFVLGLGRMIESGQSTTGVFKELELTDSRLMNAMRSTAGAGDLLTQSLDQGRAAWEANNALQSEAEKRYETTAAKMEIARNNIVDMGINIGGVLLPALASGAQGVSTLAQGFTDLPGPLKLATGGIGGAVVGIGAMAAGAAILVPKIKAARDALMAMGTAGKFAAGAMPWLAAAAAALTAVSYVFGENAKKAEAAEDAVKGYADSIREAGNVADGTRNAIEGLVSSSPAFAELLDKTGTSVDDVSAALTGMTSDYSAFKTELISSAEAAGVSGDAMAHATLGLDGMRESARKGAEEADTLGRVLGDSGDAAEEAAPPVEGLAAAYGMTAEEAEAAEKAVKDYQDALRAGIDPVFGMFDALQGNAAAQQAYTDAIAANKDAIGDNNVSQRELGELLKAVGDTALDTEVAASELAGAMAAGDVTAEGFKAQLDRWVESGAITAEQAAGLAWQFGLVASKADEVDGGRTARLYAEDHASGIINRVNGMLDGLNRSVIARIKVQLDNPYARVPGFDLYAGRHGMVTAYAGGGINEAHVAHGDVLRYAEPETGGEAFIPRLGNRDRSLGILEVAAGWYGAKVVEMQAGGFYSSSGSGSSSSSSSASYVFAPNIAVHATPGTDGRRVGQEIVDHLTAWSRDNGPLPTLVTSG